MTMTPLFDLLPAVYRERDQAVGDPLARLLGIVDGQSAILAADIARLYDDLFAETAAPWVLPYIGDLVGNVPLHGRDEATADDGARRLFPDLRGPSLAPDIAARRRADVAKTIYYRRRKGTPPMLEELARDVTGWATHLVEFFQVLGWTQMVRNHVRPEAVLPDLRSVERCDRVGGPFDRMARCVDVRPIGRFDGRHAPRTLGFHVWRLGAFELAGTDARRDPVDSFGWHVSPLGQAAPLFAGWSREGDEAGMTGEAHVPGPIRKTAFHADLVAAHARSPVPLASTWYTTPPGDPAAASPPGSLSITLWRGPTRWPVPTGRVICADLSTFRQPPDGLVAVDVALGRIAIGAKRPTDEADVVGDEADRVETSHHYGFPAALGGGPYERRAWTIRQEPLPGETQPPLVLRVRSDGADGAFATITGALADWAGPVHERRNAIIAIEDSRTYRESLQIEPRDGGWLAIEAASGARPHILGDIEVTGNRETASVTLSGLLVEGRLAVTGSLGRLRLLHTTLVPGPTLLGTGPETGPAIQPSLVAEAGSAPAMLNERLEVEIAFSITGPLVLPRHCRALRLLDSIVAADPGGDAIGAVGQPGPPTSIERSTVLGRATVEALLLASETLFEGHVHANRRQQGCLRFSHVPPGSRTPRRYRCQPDLAIARAVAAAEAAGLPLGDADRDAIATRVGGRVVPAWTTRRYGQPGFAQLHATAPVELSTGAEDGAEMGAFCHLKQPQRLANLRRRLDEYLPFGLDAGILPVT